MKVPIYPYQNLEIAEETEKHYWCLCPFHNDHTPSFTINRTNPFYLYYRCWGCGRNGSPKKFARIYLNHKQPDIPESKVKEIKRPDIDWNQRIKFKCKSLGYTLANRIGVSVNTIMTFDFGYFHKTKRFLIPMYSEKGICGIQEHWWESGEHKKRCQRHSKHGYFAPSKSTYKIEKPTYLCEGFSDTAVVIECGFQAIGRFNALSSFIHPDWNRDNSGIIIIVSDTDKVGIKGSKKLQQLIPNSKILIPYGYGDIRSLYLDKGKKFTKAWLKGEIYL